MTNCVFNKASYPMTYQLLGWKNDNCFVQLATWDFGGFGAKFRDAFEQNLSLTFTEDLFKHDRGFRAEITGEKESNFMSRISELWLAAYLVREGYEPKRVKPKNKENTPDFRITVKTGNNPRAINLEVKRICSYDNPRDMSAHPGQPIWPSAPNHLYQTDLISQVDKRLSDPKGKTGKQLGWEQASGVFALDIALCHDFERLLYADSDADAISWLRAEIGDEAKQKNANSILCFASTLDSPALHSLRWFTLSE